MSYGAKTLSLQTVWTAVFDYQSNVTEQQIIHELRLPRVLGAALVGAAFAVAGALMQGITRNPLADAGILGINGGAMFVVALCFAFPGIPYSALMFFLYWCCAQYAADLCDWGGWRRIDTAAPHCGRGGCSGIASCAQLWDRDLF